MVDNNLKGPTYLQKFAKRLLSEIKKGECQEKDQLHKKWGNANKVVMKYALFNNLNILVKMIQPY